MYTNENRKLLQLILGGVSDKLREVIYCIPDTSRADTRLCDKTIEPLQSEILKEDRCTLLEPEEEVYRCTYSESYNFLTLRQMSKYLDK